MLLIRLNYIHGLKLFLFLLNTLAYTNVRNIIDNKILFNVSFYKLIIMHQTINKLFFSKTSLYIRTLQSSNKFF